jgi:hypothetical protein
VLGSQFVEGEAHVRTVRPEDEFSASEEGSPSEKTHEDGHSLEYEDRYVLGVSDVIGPHPSEIKDFFPN